MSSALNHHGIKGQKWGVRRYQYADGTLTPAGKKRYSGDGGDVRYKKDQYKSAKRDYNKSFNKAYNRAAAAYSPIKKYRDANDARWEDAENKAKQADKARKEYKAAKKAYDKNKKAARETIKENAKKIKKKEIVQLVDEITGQGKGWYDVTTNKMLSYKDVVEATNYNTRKQNAMVYVAGFGAMAVTTLAGMMAD